MNRPHANIRIALLMLTAGLASLSACGPAPEAGGHAKIISNKGAGQVAGMTKQNQLPRSMLKLSKTFKRSSRAIEVKAGESGSLKSMLQFIKEKKSHIACRFDLNTPSLQNITHSQDDAKVNFKLLSLPLYMCTQTRRILAEIV